uniref:Putative secreted protein n=1 Tax=Ixodes ricinus TaxID=34613 RepID=V5H2T6_IXORI
MKTFIAALCFLVAQSCVIALLTESECRNPVAVPSCEEGAMTTLYSFFDYANKCESYTGCGSGTNIFYSYGDCLANCPYGEHHPPGRA